MSDQPPRPPTRRSPLGEATRRVNNTQRESRPTSKNSAIPHQSPKHDTQMQIQSHSPGSPVAEGEHYQLRENQRIASPNSNAANPRLSAISKDYAPTDSNRHSQISTVSTSASDGKRIKSYIGPWKLGKTLGKGATARVRLARHAYTGQEAAVKIVQKKNAQISQAGSLAALDKAESIQPDSEDGLRRMPIGVEREIAIMKLIQHPNIMKLYDIWENRTEIYLVLEYVDNGELFEVINSKGRLEEEEAIGYFRQILGAVAYCHSLQICHRDLKPENILVTKQGQIKIADFGMAALHQSPDHRLKTSCGSPHYAAPELIKGGSYRGDKTDIWSLGVILYATLAGRLPFDTDGSSKDWIGPLLVKIKKGAYEMAPEFSDKAADLIWRILQVNPRDRITMSQIWKHPVVKKYDYLDGYGGGSLIPLSPSVKNCGRPVNRRSDIDKEILRHLRSMWHRLTEQQIIDALLSEDSNDQKLFYSLLVKYRDAQLENYTPDLEYSTSDYHHVRPLAMTKTYSTCHFPQTKSKSKGHGRQISRFTVISNVAETEQSYDPFKASHPQHLDTIRLADYAKVTIHRTRPGVQENDDAQSDISKPRQTSRTSVSVPGGSDHGRQKLAPPRAFVSRSSLASSTRSRNSALAMRAPVGHKRGVSFTHMRDRSNGSHLKVSTNAKSAVAEHHSNHTEVTGNGGDSLHPFGVEPSAAYIRSRKAQAAVSNPLVSASKAGRGSQLWTEDVRQLSSSLAMDCDKAFNQSSVISVDETKLEKSLSSLDQSRSIRHSSPLDQSSLEVIQKSRVASLDNRPLPPPPAQSESVRIELLEARKQAELRKLSGGDGSPRYLDRMVSHLDRLMQPSSPINENGQRRVASAPVETKYNIIGRPLPSIYETGKEGNSPRRPADFVDDHRDSRVASAPEPRQSNKKQLDHRFTRPDSRVRDTIRVVNASSPRSPVKIPAPLSIRKKSSQGGPSTPKAGNFSPGNSSYSNGNGHHGLELRQQYHQAESNVDVTPDLARIDEDRYSEDRLANESNTGTTIKRKPGWFNRNSKPGEGDFKMSIKATDTMPSQPSSNDTLRPKFDPAPPIIPKKKGFSLGRLFKKRFSKTDMTVGAMDIFDDNSSANDSIADLKRQYHPRRTSNSEDARNRQIEPRRNWLSKLFNVKPASKFICFSVSKSRARQEIATILKEWKRYGIKDVQVDKRRSIVFGKLGAKNFLDMKEVAFAGEIMTVIEHGKKSHLSIARFTQEMGAASSFLKVVDTLETVLKCRGMLVQDDRKRRMMIKTLNAAS